MKENIKLIFSILWGQVSSLLFVLLIVSAGVSFFLGEKTDGFIIASITFINIALDFFQEFKASRASQKLLGLISSRVYVLREGRLVEIPSSDIVLGDIAHLVSGSIAPADFEVLEIDNAFVDDSMRTGETLPKQIRPGEPLLAGASITSGKIIGKVIAVGEKSSVGKYKNELESVKKWSSFTLFTSRLTKYIFIFSLSALIIAFIFLVLILGKFDLIEFFVFGIALLVGVVPEALPLIITLILTRESITLSKSRTIVKRLSALQELGAVQFLLTDKTGTITENKLKVSEVRDLGNFWQISNIISEGEYERTPMDEAYDTALNKAVLNLKTSPQIFPDRAEGGIQIQKIIKFEPFQNEKGYAIFHLENGEKIIRGQFAKIISICKMPDNSMAEEALVYEKKGMRVVALARERDGICGFVGFAVFEDPIKATAGESIKEAHTKGIGVKILTGDSQAVALYVSEDLGLIKHPDNIISLEALKVSVLSDHQLRRVIVFAKCTPENKLELIERYEKLGPVAFLGDGINDALALKRADIGIAVDNAADIAKQSADVILLEKDIEPILAGVSMGRKALRNILTYITYTLSGNAGTFFSLLIASFFYTSLPMLPIQILLNNLLTDLPLMLIITDNPDKYAVSHVPHYEPKKIMRRVFVFGIISTVFDFIYFQIYKNSSVEVFQTGWFVLSVITELALVLSIRSSRQIFKAPPLSVSLGIAIFVSAVLPFIFVYNNYLANIFKFTTLSLTDVEKIFGIVVIYIFANEIAKYFMRRKNLYNKPATPPHIFKS